LTLVVRRGGRLAEIATSLRATYGVRVRTPVADLALPHDLERVAQYLESDDEITLLVNNAGVSTFGQVSTTDLEAFDAMTDVNVVALVRMGRVALAAFIHRDCQTLTKIGSTLGFNTLPIGGAAYSGTKGYAQPGHSSDHDIISIATRRDSTGLQHGSGCVHGVSQWARRRSHGPLYAFPAHENRQRDDRSVRISREQSHGPFRQTATRR
jgi:hypothetical protein